MSVVSNLRSVKFLKAAVADEVPFIADAAVLRPYGRFLALAYAREEHPFPVGVLHPASQGRSVLPTRPCAGRDTR
jgi:hypothetical protein